MELRRGISRNLNPFITFFYRYGKKGIEKIAFWEGI